MRIGMDIRYLSHGLVGGVHTYVTHIVPTLSRLAGEHRVYLYADCKHQLDIETLPSNVVRTLPWRGPAYSVYNDLFMQRAVAADDLDVMHFPANYGFGPAGVPVVVTVHDEINILPLREIVRGHPKTPKTVLMMTYLHFATLASLRRAALVLTVSEYAKREIVRVGRVRPEQVIAIHHGLSPDVRRVEEQSVLSELRQRLGLLQPFLLADGLKNPRVLLRAWKLLPVDIRRDAELVFFSRSPSPPDIVLESIATGESRLVVRPSRQDLIALYSIASGFVFPSWMEGFGIPVLEAMACGAPVLASDRGAIPEVAGGAALLCDAEDADTLAAHMALLLTQPRRVEEMREAGFARAAKFSWDRTARQIWESYQRAIEFFQPNRTLELNET